MNSVSSIPSNRSGETAQPTTSGNVGEVFRVFLKLGLTSFGGPIAHLGYYREELVVRRKWIDEPSYVDLVALCQFLPGPASSQVGFSFGLLRGNGLLGGLAAWLGFTMPSALILLAFALSVAAFAGPIAEGFLHGLKLVAVAVVAQAVWGMTRTLTPDRARAMIALAAIAVVVIVEGSFGQIAAIALGAVAGLRLCRGERVALSGQLRFPVSRRGGAAALALFAALFLIPLVISGGGGHQAVALFEAFYRSGALVFGGGHVVLPLLQAQVVAPGWVTNETFLAGYGLVQAVPGPLFTFAAYLGAVTEPTPNGVAGAIRSDAELAHGLQSFNEGDEISLARGFRPLPQPGERRAIFVIGDGEQSFQPGDRLWRQTFDEISVSAFASKSARR